MRLDLQTLAAVPRMGDGGREDHMKGTTPGGLARDFFFQFKVISEGIHCLFQLGRTVERDPLFLRVLSLEILQRGRPRVGCHPLAVLPGDRVPVRIVEKKRGKKEKKEEKGEGIFPYYSDICR